MSRSILVTGGSGVLGSFVIRQLLESGYTHITGTYQGNEKTIPEDLAEKITWKPLLLPDQMNVFETVAGHQWVVHCAGLVSYSKSDLSRLLEINQSGTAQIVDACLAHQVEHLIYISSIAALGREKDGMTLDENSWWTEGPFNTSYGLSKYLGELEVWRGAGEGLPVSVILPSVILGTGDWHRSSLQLIERIVSKPGIYPTGRTGFVDVLDVSYFITLLLEKQNTGERWLLSGSNQSYGEIFEKIGSRLVPGKKFRPAPRWAAKLYLIVSKIIGRSHLGLEVLKHSYGHFSFDNAKSISLAGYTYRPLEETIERICVERLEEGHLGTGHLGSAR